MVNNQAIWKCMPATPRHTVDNSNNSQLSTVLTAKMPSMYNAPMAMLLKFFFQS